jgi:iron-sulfur cluster repair protein YtfE (RIC family)
MNLHKKSGPELRKANIRDVLNELELYMRPRIKEAVEVAQEQLHVAEKITPDDTTLQSVLQIVRDLKSALYTHLAREYRLLYPVMRNALNGTEAAEIKAFVQEMISEHAALKETLAQLRRATADYTPKPKASPSQKLAFAQLNVLEQDLNMLFYVEEEYLFPKITYTK